MSEHELTRDAVLRIGEVCEVDGRRVTIKVDKAKNLTDIFFNGDVVKNISVNSFIEIRKGFLTIIAKVDGERIEERYLKPEQRSNGADQTNKNERRLTVSLAGYLERDGKFSGGTKELPLIGNEAYIVTRDLLFQIHNLIHDDGLAVTIGSADTGDTPIALPVDGLFNSHIAIFGNTGSGKSNTLASLYQGLCRVLDNRNSNAFKNNTRFLLFDFNGEYSKQSCITSAKKVYNLSTGRTIRDRLPISLESFLDIEMLSILCSATDKTQKPFLKRTTEFYRKVYPEEGQETLDHFKNTTRKAITLTLQMADKEKASLGLEYLRQILPDTDENGAECDIREGLNWYNGSYRYSVNGSHTYFDSNPDHIKQIPFYTSAERISLGSDFISCFIKFLYLQLAWDVLTDRAQNEHIAPAMSKLKSKQKDIDKLFFISDDDDIWKENFVVINLSDVNTEMKKIVPLLICKKIYAEHKSNENSKSLTIIIDEAHNILSTESVREAESWKDYRLETFEEIIKEGRKFGVFVTIASQRPNDISPTIISQAHNYFIHRLVNHKDLLTISNAVSYIDRISEESIPTLPTGTCIFSGVASQMPLKLNVYELPDHHKPQSHTLRLSSIVPEVRKSSTAKSGKAKTVLSRNAVADGA